MIGRRSIFKTVEVKNIATKEMVKVTVQADKLYRICDIRFPEERVAPTKPTTTTKEDKQAYAEAKAVYDAYCLRLRNMRQTAMNHYKGRQLNDPNCLGRLQSLLFILVNE